MDTLKKAINKVSSADNNEEEEEEEEGARLLSQEAGHQGISLEPLPSTSQPPPQDLTLFEAAQRGLVWRISELVSQGMQTVNDRDVENCTPLHWAAINNQMDVAKFLVDKGAQVDAKGGNLMATPLHWAARAGHIQMVSYLIKKGANPSESDNQGYNALHLAAHAGHAMMMVYLQAIGMDLNCPDAMGRTSLMWLAYQGTSLEAVRFLLKQSVDIEAVDQTGFTALHWAAISCHLDVIKVLLEAGANHERQDPSGKTPRDWAMERQLGKQFDGLLSESGLYSKRKKLQLDSKASHSGWALRVAMGLFPWYIGIPTWLGLLYLIHTFLLFKYLLSGGAISYAETPIGPAILWCTLLVVMCSWLTTLSTTLFLYFEHFLFLVSIAITSISLYKTMTSDPGYLRISSSRQEQKQVVLNLADEGRLDKRHFCLACSLARPLRSKHCRVCDKCVAKFDHHCPWTYNCGLLNHRSFLVFILSLVVGGFMYVRIAIHYLDYNAPTLAAGTECYFTTTVCQYLEYSTWTMGLIVWIVVNLCWLIFLDVTQLFQVATAKTSNESINYHRFEYLVHPDDIHLPTWKKRFVNPFDIGMIGNCIDFWTHKGSLRDINYFTLYQVPGHLQSHALEKSVESDDEDAGV